MARARAMLEQAARDENQHVQGGMVATVVAFGEVPEEILRVAEQEPMTLAGVARVLLGSVAEALLCGAAQSDVLIARPFQQSSPALHDRENASWPMKWSWHQALLAGSQINVPSVDPGELMMLNDALRAPKRAERT